jgi:hypothetical protein
MMDVLKLAACILAISLQACQPQDKPIAAAKAPVIVQLPEAPRATEPDYNTMGSDAARQEWYCAGVLIHALDAKLPEQRERELSLAYDAIKKSAERSLEADGLSRLDSFAFVRHWEERGRSGKGINGVFPSVEDCIRRASQK